MLLKVAILVGVVALTNAQAVDNTVTPKTKGNDIVDAVVSKIQRSGIFSDDRELLRRVAFVESLFGNHRNTFRSGYYGGIWQVDHDKFNLTQVVTPTTKKLHDAISAQFKIEWTKLIWEDLLKPLHSGLAARMVFATIAQDIPDDRTGQANYWKRHYNSNDKKTAEHFLELVVELEGEDAKQVGGEIDLTLVIDGSGSIGTSAFENAKTAISGMVMTFNQQEANIGVVVYSSSVSTRMPFNSTSSIDELAQKIKGLGYPGSGTNTNAGMMAAVRMYDGFDARQKAGIPRVMLIFTDGGSNEGGSPSMAATAALQANITTMAFAIGNGINDDELLLIANGKRNNVVKTLDYETFKQQIARIARRAKEVPKRPPIGTVQTESFSNPGEKRYFRLEVPQEGLTVELNATEGKVRGFYSYTVEQPSSAIYDGIVKPGKTFIPAPNTTSEASTTFIAASIRRHRRDAENDTTTEMPPAAGSVYISIESQAANTTATMDTVVGDKVGRGSASTITISTAVMILMLAIAFNR